jgi:hypothetical protein
VGDYALNLARQLSKDFNIQTHFVVGNPTWQGASEIEGFRVSQISDSSANKLVELLRGDRSCPVLLHYVGYGYAQRGCPVWLINALEQWKSQNSEAHLITMFHEIYASSNLPWTSSFWLSPLQKNLATRLVKLSDRCWTSQQKTSNLLSKLTDGNICPTFSLPVFSNIGESNKVSLLSERSRKLVVFGTYGRRLPIYQNSIGIFKKIIKDLEITEIIDIGKPLPLAFSEITDVPIIFCGEQPSSVIHSIFQDSVAGIIDYSVTCLAKSTIFGAYCAYGMLPIVVGSDKPEDEVDGLITGKHYLLPNSQSPSLNLEIAQSISTNAYDWYQDHNLSVYSQTFAKLLLQYSS